MKPEQLYEIGMRPERFGWAIRPLRRVLWRLLRPFMLLIARRLQELSDAIEYGHGDPSRLEARFAEHERRLADRLVEAQRRIVELEAGVVALHGEQHLQEAQLQALHVRIEGDGRVGEPTDPHA
jgi:hypothetical protein